MYENYPNPYLSARKYAGMERKDVAMAIHVSYESLKDYELSKTIPSQELVLNMCDLYLTPWLAIKHEYRNNPIFRRMVKHEIKEFDNRAEAAINLTLEIEEFRTQTSKEMLNNVAGRNNNVSWQDDIHSILRLCIGLFCTKEKSACTAMQTPRLKA